MAVTAAKLTTAQDTTWGNKRVRPRRLTFTSTYTTGGEAITAALFGLRRIESVQPHGNVAMASDVATGCPIGWNAATSKLVFFEGSAAGTALSEKTTAEAYPTGCFLDVTAVGS